MQPADYRSFLVRIWGDPQCDDSRQGWRAEVEHVQSGRRWQFRAPADLLAFLGRAATTGDLPGE